MLSSLMMLRISQFTLTYVLPDTNFYWSNGAKSLTVNTDKYLAKD